PLFPYTTLFRSCKRRKWDFSSVHTLHSRKADGGESSVGTKRTPQFSAALIFRSVCFPGWCNIQKRYHHTIRRVFHARSNRHSSEQRQHLLAPNRRRSAACQGTQCRSHRRLSG